MYNALYDEKVELPFDANETILAAILSEWAWIIYVCWLGCTLVEYKIQSQLLEYLILIARSMLCPVWHGDGATEPLT